jgi:hypothetical protein
MEKHFSNGKGPFYSKKSGMKPASHTVVCTKVGSSFAKEFEEKRVGEKTKTFACISFTYIGAFGGVFFFPNSFFLLQLFRKRWPTFVQTTVPSKILGFM